jgi:lipoprotein-anchoring transpeptidase ErfK/SrfK
MLSRRDLITSALAIGSLGISPALADRRAANLQPVQVRLRKRFAPGEIHVDPNAFKLYWTLPGNRAIQYAVGVGRDNLYQPGVFFIGAKKEWPSWTPTREMIAREPRKYRRFANGMPGGINNPLGARALYLFTREQGDTFLRIHGTAEPQTIGSAVSNGCVRLVNEQVIELYNRVPVGTRVVLNPKSRRGAIIR